MSGDGSIARVAELLSRGSTPPHGPRTRGLRRLARASLVRLLRPYSVFQHERDEAILAALRQLEAMTALLQLEMRTALQQEEASRREDALRQRLRELQNLIDVERARLDGLGHLTEDLVDAARSLSDGVRGIGGTVQLAPGLNRAKRERTHALSPELGSELQSDTAHVICLATVAQLAHARVTVQSVRRVHPEWTAEVMLIATRDRAAAENGEVAVRSIAEALHRATEIQGADTEDERREIELLLARHHPEALIALLVPPVLRWRRGVDGRPTIHLPAGAWVLGRLDPLLTAVKRSGVALVPRLVHPLPDDGALPDVKLLAEVGQIAIDLIAVGASTGRPDFLEWWSERVQLAYGSLDGRKQARLEEREWIQRSLGLAPALFGAEIVEDPGSNVSVWNLQEHSLKETPDGIIVDEHSPLRLIALADYAPDRPHELSPRATRHRLSRMPALRSICIRYADELRAAGWPVDGLRPRLGEPLANGMPFDDALHALYWIADASGTRLGDIFAAEGFEAFLDWLTAPAPRGAASGISRYLLYRVLAERPDVPAAFPDLDGADGPRLAAWCHLSGRDEMAIPDRLLPPLPDGPPSQVEPTADRRPSESYDSITDLPTADVSTGPRVRVSGYLGHVFGLGTAARGYARALTAAGVDVFTLTAPLPSSDVGSGYGRDSCQNRAPDGNVDAELICINADQLPWFMDRFGSELNDAVRIGIWAWETDRIPTRWSNSYELLDEIWVYSHFMMENLSTVSPIPVMALPPSVMTPSDQPRQRLGVPDGFLYLFMFDYHSNVERKNPIGLIDAFTRAFADREGPRLLIKTFNAPQRPIEEEQLIWAIGDRSDIHLIDASLTTAERDGLLAACDCYVSLHRSEGFGLTLAEAMAAGKPVIGTGYSGNLDFMNERNSFLVNYELARVGPDAKIYPADGTWAEPDVDHAAALLRRVYQNPGEAARIARQGRDDVAQSLSEKTTGERMRRRIQQLTEAPSG